MKLTLRQLQVLQQALGYAVMYAKTEHETAEFTLIKLDIEESIIRENQLKEKQIEHDKKGCIFQYCSLNPHV